MLLYEYMYVDSTVDTYLNNFLLMFLMSWSYFNHSYCVFSLFNLKWNNTGPHRYSFCCTYFLILYYISLHLIIIFFIHSSVWLRLTLYSLVSAKFSLSEKKLPGSDSNPRMLYSMSATEWRVFWNVYRFFVVAFINKFV